MLFFSLFVVILLYSECVNSTSSTASFKLDDLKKFIDYYSPSEASSGMMVHHLQLVQHLEQSINQPPNVGVTFDTFITIHGKISRGARIINTAIRAYKQILQDSTDDTKEAIELKQFVTWRLGEWECALKAFSFDKEDGKTRISSSITTKDDASSYQVHDLLSTLLGDNEDLADIISSGYVPGLTLDLAQLQTIIDQSFTLSNFFGCKDLVKVLRIDVDGKVWVMLRKNSHSYHGALIHWNMAEKKLISTISLSSLDGAAPNPLEGSWYANTVQMSLQDDKQLINYRDHRNRLYFAFGNFELEEKDHLIRLDWLLWLDGDVKVKAMSLDARIIVASAIIASDEPINKNPTLILMSKDHPMFLFSLTNHNSALVTDVVVGHNHMVVLVSDEKNSPLELLVMNISKEALDSILVDLSLPEGKLTIVKVEDKQLNVRRLNCPQLSYKLNMWIEPQSDRFLYVLGQRTDHVSLCHVVLDLCSINRKSNSPRVIGLYQTGYLPGAWYLDKSLISVRWLSKEDGTRAVLVSTPRQIIELPFRDQDLDKFILNLDAFSNISQGEVEVLTVPPPGKRYLFPVTSKPEEERIVTIAEISEKISLKKPPKWSLQVIDLADLRNLRSSEEQSARLHKVKGRFKNIEQSDSVIKYLEAQMSIKEVKSLLSQHSLQERLFLNDFRLSCLETLFYNRIDTFSESEIKILTLDMHESLLRCTLCPMIPSQKINNTLANLLSLDPLQATKSVISQIQLLKNHLDQEIKARITKLQGYLVDFQCREMYQLEITIDKQNQRDAETVLKQAETLFRQKFDKKLQFTMT